MQSQLGKNREAGGTVSTLLTLDKSVQSKQPEGALPKIDSNRHHSFPCTVDDIMDGEASLSEKNETNTHHRTR